MSSPNEVGWTAKFDQAPIGSPSAASARITVTVRFVFSSCSRSSGTSSLRWKASKARLLAAPSSWLVPSPTLAGSSEPSASTIASAIPSAVIPNTRGSKRSPPSAW